MGDLVEIMGNDASKNIVLNTEWTPEAVSQFMLKLNDKQTKLIFKDRKSCNSNNLHDLIIDTVGLYLLNVNVRLIKGAKVEDINVGIEQYKKKGTIREETEPILKFILENKLKGQYKEIALNEYSDVVGTWIQSYQSTMNSL